MTIFAYQRNISYESARTHKLVYATLCTVI